MSARTLVLSLLLGMTSTTVLAQDDVIGGAWGDIDYKGAPWVANISRPNRITKGLQGRHITVWASHGRYYDLTRQKWEWQRPNLFATNEDLFTQTIVVPFLIPMLEKAGACVFTPRERDWQTKEYIVDNDDAKLQPFYTEQSTSKSWHDAGLKGFARHDGPYVDGENPFEKGTLRMAKVTRKKNASTITYQPSFEEAGRYAVYVSYQTVEGQSVDDALYIVRHKGQSTEFRVNQQMGGGTWVYLGTFDFDKGCNRYNCVVATNNSHHRKGIVTSDAVRFGGGMGNIQRGGSVSGLPRCLEGARYYAQWAGAPVTVYSTKGGTDDYGDDIHTRSTMLNWLAGGSVFMPSLEGKKVPMELSLAVHSDAGYSSDYKTVTGSLAICTTNFNEGRLNAGISRMASRDFASMLLQNTDRDLKAAFSNWNIRYLWDRNYSETRLPEVPSAILETMSHQNFADMRLGQDPYFKFVLARSIYKTILRFITMEHEEDCVVQPLSPKDFSVTAIGHNKVKISWNPQSDSTEPSSKPTSYNIYTASGTSGFDNGINVKGTSYMMEVEPGVQYNFRVTACNAGGESFPTETLSACLQPNATKTILIINGFQRLSSPEVIDNATSQGFDLDKDVGVSYGLTAGWVGKQTGFDKSRIGTVGPGGLGWSGDELAGHFIAGNDFNYIVSHAEAIASAKIYNVVSCSRDAVEGGLVSLDGYDAVDLILGLEKSDGHSLNYFKTFTPRLRNIISGYANRQGGSLLVSGSYVGSDMKTEDEKNFLSSILKTRWAPSDSVCSEESVNGLGMNFNIVRKINPQHYASTSVDILQPESQAICAMQYADGTSAAVAFKDNTWRCFTMGFPFECISGSAVRDRLMRGILNYLLN